MSTINIAGHIKELMIFDDPYYCCSAIPVNMTSHMVDKCRGLTLKGRCSRFNTGHPDNYLRLTSSNKFEKCQPCKEAYQAAKIQKALPTAKMNLTFNAMEVSDGDVIGHVLLQDSDGKEELCEAIWKGTGFYLEKLKCTCEPFQSCEKCQPKLNVDFLNNSLEC